MFARAHRVFWTYGVVLGTLGGILPNAWGQSPSATLVINEIDYDQPGTDTAEFIEIKNVGPSAVNLDDVIVLQLVNGTGGGAAVYQSIDLPDVDLAAGDYYVVCANSATVANCDLDVTSDMNLIQNGAPDAVALLQGDVVLDTVSYEGDTGAPYTETSGTGLEDDPDQDSMGISRCPDGIDTNVNNVDFVFTAITPGAPNDCGIEPGQLVINEMDYDQPGADTAEFIEIKNVGPTVVNLDDVVVLQLVNGTGGGAGVYQSIDLPDVDLAAGDYYVVCANSATVANCDLDVSPDTNLIQNGSPDAVALLQGDVILDTVSYEGDTGAPYTETSGAGLEDDASDDAVGISRCSDGVDTDVNNVDFVLAAITPGAPNDCEVEPAQLVINEVDYDQPGTDTAEFIEIKNVGASTVNLDDVIVLQLVNGSGGGAAVYQSIDLPNVDLAAGDYYVVCGNAAMVANCDFDVNPDTNLIQNGSPDAVALLQADVILDTVSYEGDTGTPYTETSGTGLEDDSDQDSMGISRCPDGIDTNVNNVDFVFGAITPGETNQCPDVTPPDITCPDDFSVECTGPDGTAVDFVVPAMDDTDPSPMVSCNPPSGTPFPTGTTTVMCTATDASDNSASCEFDVTVEDTTAPTVTCSLNETSLWPPNHNLHNVGLETAADDECDASVEMDVTVYSDEDDLAPGSGNHSPDAKLKNEVLRLRAERSGDGNGRVYLIVTTATDDEGNVGVSCCAVVVPLSQSAAHKAAVAAEAAEALESCGSEGSSVTPYVVGDGPIVGPKQ